MDEEQYDSYLRAISGFDDNDHEYDPLQELRDLDGLIVSGCYRVAPLPTE